MTSSDGINSINISNNKHNKNYLGLTRFHSHDPYKLANILNLNVYAIIDPNDYIITKGNIFTKLESRKSIKEYINLVNNLYFKQYYKLEKFELLQTINYISTNQIDNILLIPVDNLHKIVIKY